MDVFIYTQIEMKIGKKNLLIYLYTNLIDQFFQPINDFAIIL